MKLSEKGLKWLIRFYPPLFFQRVWVKKFHENFRGVDVVIVNSIFNRNYNASIFGGTIFAAADPFYPILIDQIFKHKGYNTVVWLKNGSVKYIKPARTNLTFTITLSEQEIEETERLLNEKGKYVSTFTVSLYNKQNELCAVIENDVYISDLNFRQNKDEV